MFFISMIQKNNVSYNTEYLAIITTNKIFFKKYLFVTGRLHTFVTDR